VHFTPELEARLAQSTAQQGRNPDELVQEVVARYFAEETRFMESRNPWRGSVTARRIPHA
jgi:hypothetical protein